MWQVPIAVHLDHANKEEEVMAAMEIEGVRERDGRRGVCEKKGMMLCCDGEAHIAFLFSFVFLFFTFSIFLFHFFPFHTHNIYKCLVHVGVRFGHGGRVGVDVQSKPGVH